jgi:hypothetical protein
MQFVLVCCALLSGCAGRSDGEALIASFEVPASEVKHMVGTLQQARGKEVFVRRWVGPGFELKPEHGAYRIRWRLHGNMVAAGASDTVLTGAMGEEPGDGLVLTCGVVEKSAEAGAAAHDCTNGPFRVEKPKTLYLGVKVERLGGFVPERVQIDVVTAPVRITWLDWLIGAPWVFGGLASLAAAVFFWRRG